ncbi:Hypothetical protein R9X50_00011400 [Acrodontium crateriforme]|uniref:Methyltransferase type 11 domain-containing protein n=1 Tax=Acrodontium crateriforme TaxID=150365 RepID=A0AAQ3M020_9PEZI|nr:Hypothetical protein R9X50_00011400 [Acrodontium crateriforme]
MTQEPTPFPAQGDDWNNLADEYVKLTNGAINAPCETLLSKANALFPFSTASAILDNGSGPGPVMNRLITTYGASIPSTCQLTCADFSTGMLAGCQHQKDSASAESPWKRVELLEQNAMALVSVPSTSYSHVLAGFVYFMTQDPGKCLAESKRVLQPGGVLALSSWESSEWIDVMGLVSVVRPDKVVPALREEWRRDGLLAEQVRKAGFRDVEVVRVPTVMALQSYESGAEMFMGKMPHMVMLMKDVTKEEKAKVREVMIEKLKVLCPTVPGHLNGMALVAVGRK